MAFLISKALSLISSRRTAMARPTRCFKRYREGPSESSGGTDVGQPWLRLPQA